MTGLASSGVTKGMVSPMARIGGRCKQRHVALAFLVQVMHITAHPDPWWLDMSLPGAQVTTITSTCAVRGAASRWPAVADVPEGGWSLKRFAHVLEQGTNQTTIAMLQSSDKRKGSPDTIVVPLLEFVAKANAWPLIIGGASPPLYLSEHLLVSDLPPPLQDGLQLDDLDELLRAPAGALKVHRVWLAEAGAEWRYESTTRGIELYTHLAGRVRITRGAPGDARSSPTMEVVPGDVVVIPSSSATSHVLRSDTPSLGLRTGWVTDAWRPPPVGMVSWKDSFVQSGDMRTLLKAPSVKDFVEFDDERWWMEELILETFRLFKSRLRPGGVAALFVPGDMCTNKTVCTFALPNVLRLVRIVWRHVRVSAVPTALFQDMHGFIFASDDVDVAEWRGSSSPRRLSRGLRFYDAESHARMFALPQQRISAAEQTCAELANPASYDGLDLNRLEVDTREDLRSCSCDAIKCENYRGEEGPFVSL